MVRWGGEILRTLNNTLWEAASCLTPPVCCADSPLGDGAFDSTVHFPVLRQSLLYHELSLTKRKRHLFAKGSISEGAGKAVRF